MTSPNDPFDDGFNSPEQDDLLAQLSARSAAHRKALAERPATQSTTRRRRHAAKGSRKMAIGLAAVSTLGLAAYLHQAAQSSSSSTLDLAAPDSQSNAAVPTTNAPTTPTTAKSSTQPSTTTPAKPGGVLGDGSFTGISSMTRWGPVQVQITVSGGKITAVNLPSYPSNDNRSVAINRNAIPTLVQSTLTAQSANVNSVSGATYTSGSYKISLQSALDKSRAAG
jgi:uncharacterized protein with FMN-binding domain